VFIRPEHKFSSLDALKRQIQQDCECIYQILCS
jgi:FAD synthase